MQCRNAGSEIEILDPIQARVLHHGLEGFLIRVHADRLSEVAVAVGILRDLLTQPGQYFEGLQVIGLLQGRRDLGKFEYQ